MSQRKRISPIVHRLAKEYKVSYNVAKEICSIFHYEYGRVIDALYDIGKEVGDAEAELLQINTHNLSF